MREPDPHGFESLAKLADTTDPSQLLPALRRAEGSLVPDNLRLVDSMRLSEEHRVGVFADAVGQLVAAPLRVTDAGLFRATPGDGAAATLAHLLAVDEQLGGGGFSSISLVPDAGEAVVPGTGERAIDVDQTHESVVVGDAAVVKWAVRAEPTPAPELIAQLTKAGFTEMPHPWGFVTWTDGQREVLIASVVQFLPGASDGWAWAVLDAGDFAARGGDLDASVEALEVVGRVVADMHVAFATPTEVMPFPTKIAGSAEGEQWRGLAHTLLDEAMGSVDGVEGDRLAALRGPVCEVFAALGDVAGTTVIAVHGDLHIGQVMRWEGGYAIGDFDGNPVLPVAERLAPQPAARDVAGMLQSIDHVGRVVLRRVDGAEADRVNIWIREAQARFQVAYRARLAELGWTHLLDDRLVRPFQVEQECREFLYAVGHLPRWRYVPDQALQALFAEA